MGVNQQTSKRSREQGKSQRLLYEKKLVFALP
jgi:hypothetical protein